jgi:hypothetical protein
MDTRRRSRSGPDNLSEGGGGGSVVVEVVGSGDGDGEAVGSGDGDGESVGSGDGEGKAADSGDGNGVAAGSEGNDGEASGSGACEGVTILAVPPPSFSEQPQSASPHADSAKEAKMKIFSCFTLSYPSHSFSINFYHIQTALSI